MAKAKSKLKMTDLEETILNEEESVDYIVGSINKRSNQIIREYLTDREVADYTVKMDNKGGEVIIEFFNKGLLEHTKTFKV